MFLRRRRRRRGYREHTPRALDDDYRGGLPITTIVASVQHGRAAGKGTGRYTYRTNGYIRKKNAYDPVRIVYGNRGQRSSIALSSKIDRELSWAAHNVRALRVKSNNAAHAMYTSRRSDS